MPQICPQGGQYLNFITTFQHTLAISSAIFQGSTAHNLFHNNLTKWVLHSNKPYRCTCQHVSLDLGKFYEAASLSTYNLKCCLEDALPAGVSVYNIAVNNVTDDFSSIAIHKQPDNLAILRPIHISILDKATSWTKH